MRAVAMSGRLLLVVGPSGAGKDSVIEWARARLAQRNHRHVRFARRTITRPLKPEGEQHLEVSLEQFNQLRERGQFALWWYANDCAYGIGAEIVDWLEAGLTVVVNGSRAHVPETLARFPFAEVILVRASEATLRQRLLARQRESARQIEERIARTRSVAVASGVHLIEILNDGELAQAGARLVEVLMAGRLAIAQVR